MTTFQKVIKYLALAFAVFLVVCIVGGIVSAIAAITGASLFPNDAVLEETKSYPLAQDYTALKIEINAAALTVVEGDSFALESNLKYLKVDEKDGKLILTDTSRSKTYNGAVLTLTVPTGTQFELLELETGAGRVTADALVAERLSLDFGAGEVNINRLVATKEAEIDGGAGEITISDAALHNLDFDMGVGELNLTARLTGNGELSCGVGETNLTLLGTPDDYKLKIDKGIGSVTVDGQSLSDGAVRGDGSNLLELDCGVGSVSVVFE